MSRRAPLFLVLLAVLLAGVVRWPLLTRQGLWVDEVFSLALATGHSLEHPAAEAEEALGDFVERATARPAQEWRALLEHDSPPAGPRRVLRATCLSDTNPPLYYLGLWAWTYVLGTSDAALRSYSLACALACLPFLAALARWAGGRRAVAPALFLFALTPLSIYYGTEGRMYAQLWLCILATAWGMVRLRLRPNGRAWSLWVLASTCGFLTHYFFAFVWGAFVLFLGAWPARAARRSLGVAAVLVGLAILPWYARLGDSLARWRVTQGWLALPPDDFERPRAALELFLGLFSGAARLQWGEHGLARSVTLGLFTVLLFVWLLWGRPLPRPRGALVATWMLAGWAGPLVFDVLQGTYTVAIARYALPAFPAAVLLVAMVLARLPARATPAFLAALFLAWGPHFDLLWRRYSRSWCPLREVAGTLEPGADGRAVVLVHSIPSGVLGIARYYAGRAPLLARVEQLGPRALPSSFAALAPGLERLDLVRIHEVGAPCPLEGWLRAEAVLVAERERESARALSFRRHAEVP
jgi:hypothetical protein